MATTRTEITDRQSPAMEILVTADGFLEWQGQRYPCALGPGGITDRKREGDGATPAGVFGLRRVLYRADRIPRPDTALAVESLRPGDGWCDDPDDPGYNRQVTLPQRASCETLWRGDGIYDLIVVIGHNDDPVVADAGSAIFLHVARPDCAPTAGCIAISKTDLLEILRQCRTGTRIRIV